MAMFSITGFYFSVALISLLTLHWASEAKVVSSFDECKGFFYNGSEPEGFDSSTVIRICQKKDSVYHFATLYSPEYRIPVYSAYTYTYSPTTGDGKAYSWLIEPQLDWLDGDDEMTRETTNVGAGENQALNSDYKNYCKGHLNPVCLNSRNPEATFTLTNAVPMTAAQNSNWYWYAEQIIRNYTSRMCDGGQLYLVTGSLPSQEFTQSGKVSIPTIVWTAVCCSGEWDQVKGLGYHFSFALIHSKFKLALDNLIKIHDIWGMALTVEMLQTTLGEHRMGWGSKLTIFPDKCQWKNKEEEDEEKQKEKQKMINEQIINEVAQMMLARAQRSQSKQAQKSHSKNFCSYVLQFVGNIISITVCAGVQAMFWLVSSVCGRITEGVMALLRGLAGAVTWAVRAIWAVGSLVLTTIASIPRLALGILASLFTMAFNLLSLALSLITSLLSLALSLITSLINLALYLITLITSLLSLLIFLFYPVWLVLTLLFLFILGKLLCPAFMANLLSFLKNWVSPIIAMDKKLVQYPILGLISCDVVNAISSIRDLISCGVVNAISSIWDLISSGLMSVGEGVANLLSFLKNWVSPIKAMGKNLVQYLILGQISCCVVKAISLIWLGLTIGIWGFFSKLLPGNRTATKNVGNKDFNYINQSIKTIKTPTKFCIDKFQQAVCLDTLLPSITIFPVVAGLTLGIVVSSFSMNTVGATVGSGITYHLHINGPNPRPDFANRWPTIVLTCGVGMAILVYCAALDLASKWMIALAGGVGAVLRPLLPAVLVLQVTLAGVMLVHGYRVRSISQDFSPILAWLRACLPRSAMGIGPNPTAVVNETTENPLPATICVTILTLILTILTSDIMLCLATSLVKTASLIGSIVLLVLAMRDSQVTEH